MTLKRHLVTLAAATAMLGLTAVAAFAGSATMKHDATLYAHPGWGNTGNSVDEDDDVWVKGCTKGYCLIKADGDTGWVKAWVVTQCRPGEDVPIHTVTPLALAAAESTRIV